MILGSSYWYAVLSKSTAWYLFKTSKEIEEKFKEQIQAEELELKKEQEKSRAQKSVLAEISI